MTYIVLNLFNTIIISSSEINENNKMITLYSTVNIGSGATAFVCELV